MCRRALQLSFLPVFPNQGLLNPQQQAALVVKRVFEAKEKGHAPRSLFSVVDHGGIDGVGKMKALAKHAPLQIVMILFKVLKDERVKMR